MAFGDSTDARWEMMTPSQTQRLIAARARDLRLTAGFTQKAVAQRAGLSLPSLRRFERTGEVSFKHLAGIFHVLGRLGELETLLKPPVAGSLFELEQMGRNPRRMRGTR